jgi:hypothetical protein
MDKIVNMKKFVFALIAVTLFASCKDSEADKKAVLPESNAKINHVSIIADEMIWNGEIGDSIRKKFAAPVDGLPQEEPLFNLNQYPNRIFEGFVRKSRNVILVTKGDKTGFNFKKDEFAIPQNVFYISGKTNVEILALLEQRAPEMIATIKDSEIKENQKRIKKALISDSKIKEQFGISLNISHGYKYDMVEDNFLWIRKEFSTGYNSILVYDVLFDVIDKDENTIGNIIAMRDSVGKQFIHGVLPNTWMITEEAYAPYMFDATIAGKKTYETKGTWELKNDFMAGPFVNYAIRDEKNQRYLILEGFTFNPSKSKRDLIFELEAIIKSVKFLK